MKVLVIEDDHSTAATIEAIVHAERGVCDISSTGEEAFEIGKIYDYDVIMLDLKLPDMSGHELLKKLRDSSIKAPILILSGLQDIEEKVKALGFGADDYMTKPFHRQELVVRLKALMRRAEGYPSSIIKAGDITLNMDTQVIEVFGAPVSLTGKEYKILELLILRRGVTITKEMFLDHLYSLDEPEAKIIDVFMCKIRKKLRLLGLKHDYIQTMWGRGYVLCDPPVTSDHSCLSIAQPVSLAVAET